MKKEELRNEIDVITSIYLDAKHNFGYCYYLYKPKTSNETEYLLTDQDLQFIRNSLWRLTIIDLSKLFSKGKNDKFNLKRFINKLKRNNYFGDMNIDEIKVSGWESKISNEAPLIESILKLRDKVYAHTDSNVNLCHNIIIYFTQVEELFKLTENIISEINSTVFDEFTDFTSPLFNRDNFSLIKILAEAHRKRIEEITKHLKK